MSARKYILLGLIYTFSILLFFLFPKLFTIKTNVLDALDRIHFDRDFTYVYDLYEKNLSRELLILVGDKDEKNLVKKVNKITDILKESPYFEKIKSNTIEEYLEIPKYYFSHRKYLLNEDQIKSLNEKPDEIEKLALEKIYSPFSASAASITKDPYLLMDEYFTSVINPTKLSFKNGFLSAHDNEKTYYAIRGRVLNGHEKESYSLLKKLKKESSEDLIFSSMSFYSVSAIENAQLESTLFSLLSLVLIILAFYFFFRTLRHLIIIVAAIMFNASIGLYITSFLFGSMHIMALLLGICILGIMADYFIHYYIKESDPRVQNGKEAFAKISKPLFWSLVTTLCGFVIFLFSTIVLLREFGAFCSVTLILTFLFIKYFLSHFFISNQVSNGSSLPLFFKKLTLFKRRSVIMISLPLFLLFLILFELINVRNDIRNFATSDEFLTTQEKKIKSLLGLPSHFEYLILKANSFQGLLEKEENLKTKMLDFKEGGAFITNWIPSLKSQEISKSVYESHFSSMKAFAKKLGVKNLSLPQNGPITKDSFLSHFPQHDINKQLFQYNDLFFAVIPLYSKKEMSRAFENENSKDFVYVNKVKFINTDIQVFSTKLKLGITLFMLGFFIALGLKYGLKNAYLLIFPASFSVIISLLLTALVVNEINLFHLLGGVLIFALGLDYSFFYFYNPKNIESSFKSILLSSVTTLSSFGVLSLSSTYAVHSFGLVVFFGVLLSFILSPLSYLGASHD